MTSEIETTRRVMEETKTVYIANDGTQFDMPADCLTYGFRTAVKALEGRDDIETCEEMNGTLPFTGGYFDPESCGEPKWYRPKTEKAAHDLMNAYFSCCTNNEIEEDIVGKWVCCMLFDDGAALYTLEDCLAYVKGVCEKLGVPFSV